MADFNKVILLGRLTRDPELRYTQSGQALAKLGLAVGRKYYNKQTQQSVEETTFVDCDAWGKQAEILNQYMRKGRPLFIEGRLKFDTWESKEGQRRSKLYVVVENFQFVDGGGNSGGGGGYGDERGSSDAAPAAAKGRGAPQVQAGKVSDGGRGDAGGGGGAGAGGEEYDFEDIPF